MFRKTLMAALASVAIVAAAPALGQAHGGGGGPHGGGGPMGGMGNMNGPAGSPGSMAGMHSQGPMNASPMGIDSANPNSVLTTNGDSSMDMTTSTHFNSNSPAAQNSQALQHASPTAIEHASANSVLARGAVSTSTLAGLATNMTVQNSTGTLGTVSRIIYGPNNATIRAVVVTSSTGKTYTLPANTLSVSGGMVMTTSTMGG